MGWLRISIILLCISLCLNLGAQTFDINNIKAEKNDSIQCQKLAEAFDHYKYLSVDTMSILAEEMMKLSQKSQSSYIKEQAFNVMSLTLKFKGEYEKAVSFAQKALELNIRRKDNQGRAKILLNYADLMRHQLQYDAAERYHREGIQLALITRDSSLLARFYINSGLVFADKGTLDSAAVYYKKGIRLSDGIPELQKSGLTARLNLSQVAYKQGKYEEMIVLAKQVYASAITSKDADHISLAANNVALGYLKTGDFEQALHYIILAENAAKEYKSPQNLLFALGNASDIYAEKGDFKSAYEKALAYIGLKDSLRTALYDKNLTEITTKYELKEKENLLNQNQLTIQKQASNQRLILFLAAVCILGLVFLFYYVKSKQEFQRKSAEVEAEKAKLAAQIEHAEVERLQQIDELRSNFFANLSHEFRTPLTLILNPSEQLLQENQKPENQKYLNIIHNNASRMLELVNQLLELSKLESGKTKLKIGEHDFKQFCVALCGLFESLAIQKEIDFKLTMPDEPVHGYFDKDVMEKILVNLISNAFKFTPAGGEIEFSLKKNGKSDFLISVRDTGIGIDPTHMDQLFNRFLSFSDSEVQQSSGIGLSLVRELVTLHKADIQVKSQLGVGSIFSVQVNLDKNTYEHDEIQTVKTDPPLSETLIAKSFSAIEESSSKPKRWQENMAEEKPWLMIAEDNPDVRILLQDICSNHFQVIMAPDGETAFQIAKEKIPDIILTDVMMPGMNGIELCSVLKGHELTSHIPVIMLTARGDRRDKITGLQQGADDYLVKPFHAEELLVRLQNLLDQRKKLREYYSKILNAFVPIDIKVDSMDAVFLKQLKSKIDENLHLEDFGVSELAHDLLLSRSQLHRKVSALTGYSPNEVIRNMRLEKAKMLLQKKTGTIAEIAYQCGFSSPAYFSKCYKDFFGYTAGEES